MSNKVILSICMIVKNEEEYLDNCLNSMNILIEKGIAELIIVDTGSTDKTIEICTKYTKNIYFFKWNNNFSDARNYSISKAKGEYIFIQDADQCIDKNSINKFLDLFINEEYKNYNTIYIKLRNYLNDNLKQYSDLKFPLIFKNDADFKYIGAVHNQPVFKEPIKFIDIQINHFGYIMNNKKRIEKFNRTSYILKKELKINPNNYYYIFQLAKSYNSIGDFKKARECVDRYLYLISKEISKENLMYYRTASQTYYLNKEFIKVINICDNVLEQFPYFLDCIYLKGLSLNKIRKYKESNIYLNKYLNILSSGLYKKNLDTEMFSLSSKNKVIEVIQDNKNKIEFNTYAEKVKNILKNLYETDINQAISIINELKMIFEYHDIIDEEFFAVTSAIYFLNRDYEKALEEVNIGLEINEFNIDLVYNKALIMDLIGNKISAINYYKKARNLFIEENIKTQISERIKELNN